jgi:hypothetical protein
MRKERRAGDEREVTDEIDVVEIGPIAGDEITRGLLS